MYARYAKIRDEKNFNDLQVAEATGIPATTIYDWKQRSAENPKAGLSADKLLKIAKLFETPIEHFLDDPETTA